MALSCQKASADSDMAGGGFGASREEYTRERRTRAAPVEQALHK